MSDTTGAGIGMAGAVTDDQVEPQTDQGVPVGAADAEADAKRAGDESRSNEADSNEEYLDQADAESGTDQGVPVGSADAEQDRLNASSEE